MYISDLTLDQFRNYTNQTIHFNERMNIIYGDNAQGKTNILEAIYVLATSKSHRTSNYKEMIQLEKDHGHITGHIIKQGIDERIDVHLEVDGGKHIAVNQVKIGRVSELFGVLNVIMFSPEDLGIIKKGPNERRRFIDIELCQVDKLYMHYLKSYHQALKQRNNLLKIIQKDSSQTDQLDVWDMQLIEHGLKVMAVRSRFIEELNPIFKDIHLNISGGKEAAALIYEMNVLPEAFESGLKRKRNYDIKVGTTSVGPHRDDLSFILNDVDIRHYGSQGQQRTAALSLKLSEIEIVKQMIDDTPILLLDDVLSELDHSRQKHLLSYLHDIQTLITCTGVEDFVRSEGSVGDMFHVVGGQLMTEA